jgi:hypothetical protein
MKSNRIIFPLFAVVVILLSIWGFAATTSEIGISFRIPRCVQPFAARAYGAPADKRFFMPDSKTAVGISYSVRIHKSQIHPWGTLWRRCVTLRLIDGEWAYCGEYNTPNY